MEIREPKFKIGDYVTDRLGFAGRVENILLYRFSDRNYIYDVSPLDENDNWREFAESRLVLYIEKPKTIWDVKEGDEFYYIAFDGDILSGKWVDAIEYRESGNVFLTLQEAETELEKRRIETEMLRLGGSRVFKKGEENWYIRYNFYTDSVDVDYNMYDSYGRGIIYFDSEEKAKEIIKTISEDKIRKYIFGAD